MMRPGTADSRRARTTEALLLLLVVLVQALGSALLLTARRPANAGAPLDINHAAARDFVRALGVPDEFATRILAERAANRGFSDVDALGRIAVVRSPHSSANTLRAAGLAGPQARGISTRSIARELRLDSPTATRLEIVRANLPTARRWERVLSAPLISSNILSPAQSRLSVRSWRRAAGIFAAASVLLALFFGAAHLLLRRFFPEADPFLLPAAALLSALGVLMLFSMKDPQRDMLSYVAQCYGIVFGGGGALFSGCALISRRISLPRYRSFYAAAALAAALALALFGTGPAGERLEVAGVQPVEAIKILTVFFLAAFLAERAPVWRERAERRHGLSLPRRADVPALWALTVLPLSLFGLVRDLGPLLLLAGTILLLIYLATGRAAFLIGGGLLLALLATAAYRMHFGVAWARIDMWRSPWQNAHKGGDQTALGLWGLASGGAFGSGLGLGATHFIPRGGSDLAIAAVGEDLGLPGTITVIVCLCTLFARGLRIALRAETDFQRYLAAGLACLIGLQGAIVLAGASGLLPLSGMTFPFLSYGKSSLIACFFSVGILLALSSARPPGILSRPNRVAAPLPFRRAARRIALAALLLAAPALMARLFWLEWFGADSIMARTVRVPDADGIARSHTNPRLLQIGSTIARGRILDRKGRVLAATDAAGVRQYPYGAAAAHLVGYLDPAVGGPTGMEARFDGELRGFGRYAELGKLWRRKDLAGFQLPRGGDVTLTVDSELQRAALAALTSGGVTCGAAVVLDARTGAVLASATLPTFEPRALTAAGLGKLNAGSDRAQVNRAVAGSYPPGAVFQIVTAAALETAGKEELTVDCQHEWDDVYWHANGTTYGRRRIEDLAPELPHGKIGLADALADSCDIYFAQAAITAGSSALRAVATHFGFEHLPPNDDFGADLPDIGRGQEPVRVSPTEMASVAQTIANHGVRVTPSYRLGRPGPSAIVLPPAAADQLADALCRCAATSVLETVFSSSPTPIAGKAGLAETDASRHTGHSWFVGFAPADHPRYAIAVLVENAGKDGAAAAPIAKRILAQAMQGH